MIGSGPFMLKSYQKGVQIDFERNPSYYMKGQPYLDGVVIEITPDAAARLSLLRAGKVDMGHMWGYMVPEEAKSLKQTNPEMVMTPTMTVGSGKLYFRTDQPPFNDVRVRRAISLAIDRKGWNDALLFGEGCIDAGPVPCAMKDWQLPSSQMDPAKAKYLVGYDPGGKRLEGGGYPTAFDADVPLGWLRPRGGPTAAPPPKPRRSGSTSSSSPRSTASTSPPPTSASTRRWP
jgi:ABC-type transport system substrate-binding protein